MPQDQASLGMENNFIWNLRTPEAPHHAANKGYVDQLIGDIDALEADVDTNEVNIVNLYNEQIKQALQIQGLQNTVNNMSSAIQTASSLDDLKSKATGIIG
jgi:hypothetical protein